MLAGRYTPTKTVLSGGQGNALICHDKWLDRDVVVKRLHTGISAQSLKKEITARQRVSSKYVAQIYDYFVDGDGEPRLVLEYISGNELCSNKIVPVTDDRTLLTLLFQLATGISDFHRCQIVHRDIKPHNCRLDAEGILRIFDLGISTDLTDTDTTKLGAGTPGFRAPELYDKGSKAVTPAIDVYAWGATAWFLATGTLPTALKTIPPQNKSAVDSFASQTGNAILAQMVDQSLSVDPAVRPSIAEVSDRLRSELTFRKHKGLLVRADGRQFALDKDNPTIAIGIKSKKQSLRIHYDGYRFGILAASGDVYVNNKQAVAGDEFPSACVVAFGSPSEGINRTYLNFCSAHPEIVF